VQPPLYRQESTQTSPAAPGVVICAAQLTAGGFGTVNAPKFMCCASLQIEMTVLDALHAYSAGSPFPSGP
jgi:hypothetical protein